MNGLVIDWFTMPALILEIGVLLLAFDLFRFARVLGELLEIIQKPPLEVLVMVAGVVLILTFVIPHYIASAVFYPNLTANAQMKVYLDIFRTISFVGMLVASALVAIPSLLYLLWTSR